VCYMFFICPDGLGVFDGELKVCEKTQFEGYGTGKDSADKCNFPPGHRLVPAKRVVISCPHR